MPPHFYLSIFKNKIASFWNWWFLPGRLKNSIWLKQARSYCRCKEMIFKKRIDANVYGFGNDLKNHWHPLIFKYQLPFADAIMILTKVDEVRQLSFFIEWDIPGELERNVDCVSKLLKCHSLVCRIQGVQKEEWLFLEYPKVAKTLFSHENFENCTEKVIIPGQRNSPIFECGETSVGWESDLKNFIGDHLLL